MELEMTEEQKKEIIERLMAIPVMEYDLRENLSLDILLGWMLQTAHTIQKIEDVRDSLEISEESRQCLEKDLEGLSKKFALISVKWDRTIRELKNE